MTANPILTAIKEKRKELGLLEAKKIASSHDIPVTESVVAKSAREALSACKQIGFPVVVKGFEPEAAVHKTDTGGVFVDIRTEKEVLKAFNEIKKNGFPKVLVEPLLKGTEVIVGAQRDPFFGPVVMFGAGGIFLELVRDVEFCLAPVTKKEAEEMIKKTKVYKILTGYRGSKKLFVDGIVNVILKVSKMMVEVDAISEFDINPLFVMEDEVVACDVRVVLA